MILLAQHICCRLLGIDPKTLRRWVALAQIPFLKSPLDARQRCLTSAHLQYLATIHDRPFDPSLLPCEPSSREQMGTPTLITNPPPQSAGALTQLQHLVETLQSQLTQLTLDLLQERARREEQEQKAKHILLASQPRASQKPPFPDESKATPSPRKGSPRALIPLIAAQADGSYLVMCPKHGELHMPPDSHQWFAWLDSLTSFRFLGQQGPLSTHRKQGTSSWMAYRRLRGRRTTFSLGPTHQLSIAHLEHMAALLQTVLS